MVSLLTARLRPTLGGRIMHKKESAREFVRRRAVELREQGETVGSICHFLNVSAPSVTRWCRLAEGGSSFDPPPPSGRPRRLSNEDLTYLSELLAQGATLHR